MPGKPKKPRTPKPKLKSYDQLCLERQQKIEAETEQAIRDLRLSAKELLGGLLAEARGEVEVEKPTGIPGMTAPMRDTNPAGRNAAWLALGKVLGIPGLNDKGATIKMDQKQTKDGTQTTTIVVECPNTDPPAHG